MVACDLVDVRMSLVKLGCLSQRASLSPARCSIASCLNSELFMHVFSCGTKMLKFKFVAKLTCLKLVLEG